MNNLEKYNSVFIENFDLKKDDLNEDLIYQSVDEWDSVGHMGLMADLEDIFEISLEIEDIVDFSSYNEGKNILKKYNIEF